MKIPVRICVTLLLLVVSLLGCRSTSSSSAPDQDELLHSPPHGVYYEIFVRSFYDSDGDGIGDLNGVTEKLDYLDELGIEGIWLMPINESPSYHGYDVTDYRSINSDYGTLEDFETLVAEAHKRDINIIMDLVVNHTSRQHPWFQEASTSEDSSYRDWFIWADEETNVIERGEWKQKLWHGGQDKYYGVFWEGMPDLNFDNPEVREEFIDIGQYWVEEYNVDGFRLDAAKHIYSHSEKKNHQWWREFNQQIKEVNPDAQLVGEVWASTSTVAPYLNEGLDSAFNFDLSSRILNSVMNESDVLINNLIRTRSNLKETANDYIDSTFITNHDMERVMSELNGDMNHAKMAASLLITLPGNPYIYYGEEIGMEGKKPDEHIREPMIWSTDPEEDGQAEWMMTKHNENRDKIAVETQLKDENSLLNHYKDLIYARRSSEVLIQGDIQKTDINETGIFAFTRTLDDQSLLVIHNLTDEEKQIQLDQEYHSYFSTTEGISIDSKDLTIPSYSTVILE